MAVRRNITVLPTGVTLPGHYWYFEPQTGAQYVVEVRRNLSGELEVGLVRDGRAAWTPIPGCSGVFQGPVVKPLN
jgi:hypothetical protein